MAQIIDSVPSSAPDPILCCYVNATSKMQIARITNVQNWYFERVVFPGQRLIFEAVPTAQLEIHCGMMASAILSDTIPCDRLKIADEAESDNGASSATSDASETSADEHQAIDSSRSDFSDVRSPGEVVKSRSASISAPLHAQKVVVAAVTS